MFSHFSLQRLALRPYPAAAMRTLTSSHSGPLSPGSWNRPSSPVRTRISASTSCFGHRDVLICSPPRAAVSPPPSYATSSLPTPSPCSDGGGGGGGGRTMDSPEI